VWAVDQGGDCIAWGRAAGNADVHEPLLVPKVRRSGDSYCCSTVWAVD
jgi:hypothetical protein